MLALSCEINTGLSFNEKTVSKLLLIDIFSLN